MKISKLISAALLSSIFLVSCSSDDNDNGTPLGTYDNGVLILNQGGFGAGNATISYLSDDFVTQQNNIFGIVNPSLTLGDTGQDIGFHQNLAFIVLNYSNKIEIVNRYSMAHVGTITEGLNNPRFITFSNGKGFVTNWGDGGSPTDDFVAVINLETYLVSSTISVVEGPERIVANAGKLYVAHAGGYGFGNSISVIDAANNTVTSSIAVGDVPNSLEIEGNSLYVISGGKPSWSATETSGKLSKISLSTSAVTSIDFQAGEHPSNLDVVGNSFYYTVDSEVYKSTLSATTLPTEALFSTNDQGVYGIYSFAVKDNKIYVGDALDYSSNGKVYIYSVTGTLEQNYTVGVIPAGFYFN